MIRELFDRRVPQFVGLYLVGGWGFLEFLDWVVTRYLLSPALVDFVVVLLLLLLPAVAWIAWRHGAPGPDAWKRKDGVIIGANLLLAAVVLFVAFEGEELGATTTVKLVEDAEGNTVERVLPKADFRRSLLTYDFEPAGDAGDLEWLGTALRLAVSLDVSQDLFVSVITPEQVQETLREAGIAAGEPIPLSLKRDAARARGAEHFLGGTYRPLPGDSLLVTASLHETRSARRIASFEYRTEDAISVADRISRDVREALGVPEGQLESSLDLPAGELVTHSPEAFRAIGESFAALVANDISRAAAAADRATRSDSTSAIAHLLRMNAAMGAGNQTAAAEAMAWATRYDYRLPERDRLFLQLLDEFLFQGDIEAAIRAGEYWTEVYPHDVEGRRMLAQVYAMAGETEGQIRQLRALVAIDTTDPVAARQLAAAYAQSARYDSAIAVYEGLRDRRPNDLNARIELAEALGAAGRFDEAREELEDAVVVAPRDPDVPRELAQLDLRLGNLDAVDRHLEEVRRLERTPMEKQRRAELEETLYYRRGQFGRVADAYRERLRWLNEIGPPVQTVQMIGNSEYFLYPVQFRRGDEALAQLDSLSRLVEAPWTLSLDASAALIHLDRGDLERARSSLSAAQRLIEYFGAANGRLAFVELIEGRIAELEDGNCRRAMDHYDRAARLTPQGNRVRYMRLKCLTSLEEWDRAGEDAEWLLENWPGRPDFRLAIAEYHAARGQEREALPHLEFALEAWGDADPSFTLAREARELRERIAG